METVVNPHRADLPRHFSFEKWLFFAAAPIPLPVINLALARLVRFIQSRRPHIFERLEGHHHKWFLIEVTNLPFVICLQPHPRHPRLKSCRRRRIPSAESRISGSFLTLLKLIDGHDDGDSLFFSRDLHISGDTEAVVCLRNALDDMDGSIADDIAAFFGRPGQRIITLARRGKQDA
jgi:predicted lipid carrier protein YhbT